MARSWGGKIKVEMVKGEKVEDLDAAAKKRKAGKLISEINEKRPMRFVDEKAGDVNANGDNVQNDDDDLNHSEARAVLRSGQFGQE